MIERLFAKTTIAQANLGGVDRQHRRVRAKRAATRSAWWTTILIRLALDCLVGMEPNVGS